MKRALAAAFDKHAREREMTSVLLSTLYNEVRAVQFGQAVQSAARSGGAAKRGRGDGQYSLAVAQVNWVG